VDERDDERRPAGGPSGIPSDPPTEQVRVVGAVRVGVPEDHGQDTADASSPSGASGPTEGSERGPATETGSATEEHAAGPQPGTGRQQDLTERGVPLLPWTDPPTGQVPAVVARSPEPEDPLAARLGGGPSWREHPHEWDDRPLASELLADAELRVGSLTGGQEAPGPGSSSEEARSSSAHSSTAGGEDHLSGLEEGPTEPAGPAGSAARAPVDDGLRGAGRGRTGSTRRVAHGSAATGPGSGRGRTGRNLPVAIASGVVFGLVALGCLVAGPLATCLLAVVVLTLAAAEAYGALQRAGYRPATLLGLVATAGIVLAAYLDGVAALPLVLAATVVLSFLWYLFGAGRGSAVVGVATTLLPVAWIGLLGSFAGLLLAPSIFPDRHGVAFFLGVLVAVVGADVGGLAVGSTLGRHRLAPEVSPGKSWEGVLGGAVLAVALSALVTSHVHPWTVGSATVLGGVAAVLAPLGDLCESLVKRDLGLKDMGGLLPGHGGLLDRFDGALFVLPAAYYLVRALHVG
jgi:phosphatidate cytidylyltransferase